MKTVLVLRHAKSDWSIPGQSDYDRTLNPRGKRTAPHMGEWILAQNLTPQLIIASSAARAMETAELVAMNSEYNEEVTYTKDFYLAPPESYIDKLNRLPDALDRVMVVGHNPGMESLVGVLTGQFEEMPTCALAVIELPIESWGLLTDATEGNLVSFWRPREILD